MSHKDSNGIVCGGCPPTCEAAKIPHVPAGLNEAMAGCCGLRFGHGAFCFDADGNCTQEMTCCAGKDCADLEPASCDAHAPKPNQVVEVEAPFVGGRFPQKVAEAKMKKKVQHAVDKANGLDLIPEDKRAETARGKARLISAGLTLEVDDKGSGKARARVMAVKKVVNPHNPDPEFHHVVPTAAEVAAVRAALGAN